MEKKVLNWFIGAVIILLMPLAAFAQTTTVSGSVTDATTGEGLWGANVSLVGTDFGSATLQGGSFKIEKVTAGSFTVKVSFIGYTEQAQEVTVTAGKVTRLNFALKAEAIVGAAISVLADRAKPRETPVAYSTVTKTDMEARLGSQDIPLALNTTPSVYSTMQGGGAGDARLSIRGFNQRNVGVMINGVPMNDMENGWVYWSNWDGVGDATSSIQVQRGLSAVNLAVASVGGTMNVLTDPTAIEAGLKFKQEVGNDGFLKSTAVANSGLIDGKYAFSGLIVRKIGDGLIDKTWTDAWAYYFGASYQMNPNNRLEFYAMGAPQMHGQNSYKQNIAAYSHEYAESLDGFEAGALTKFKEASTGLKYNQTWGPISASYTGKQYWNGKEHDRYASDFMNERENYFHKPLVNLNWYSKLTEKMFLYSTAYYSGGTGGGSGTFGSMKWNTTAEPTRFVDWDATIANNKANATGSKGILRNSVNNQWTVGLISKANYKMSESLNTTFGLDWRTAEIDHFREIRDLLGGEYFLATHSQFWTTADQQRKLGDKIDYHFTNTVDWLGGFGQAEYTAGQITAYGMGGYSVIQYDYLNHFKKGTDGNELTAKTDWIGGYQVKGGASYRFNEVGNVFTNLGYVSKVPIFDDVIDDGTGTKAEDPKNQKFTSVEGGVNYSLLGGKLALNGNLYYTIWKDRSNTRNVEMQDGTEGIVFIQGIDLTHSGIELEAAYQPISLLRLDVTGSVGKWEYTDDVTGVFKNYSLAAPDVKETYYLKGLKVGDAPQTQLAVVGSLYPVDGLMGQVVLRHYRNHYADWAPNTRNTEEAKTNRIVWNAPNYNVIDFHASYKLPINLGGIGLQVFGHVFNALDTKYVQDAVDNSAYNSFDKDHDADDAEVYMGLPRSFNVGLTLSY
jgi:hypothetical protein